MVLLDTFTLKFAIVAGKNIYSQQFSDPVTFYVSYTRLLIDFTTRLNWTLNWLSKLAKLAR